MLHRVSYTVEKSTISALVCGNPKHPIALFLHGIPACAKLWQEVLPAVSQQGWYCIAPDCPGYGQTVVSEKQQYRLEGSAALFIKWLRQEGHQKIWLIGHDIGGGIAQIMLTQAEDLFEKATLSNCATAATWPVPIIKLMKFIAQLGLFPFVAKSGLAELFGNASLRNAFHNKEKLTDEVKHRIFFNEKMRTAEGRKKFAELLKQLSSKSTQNNMAALASVQLPVHLVWAMNDPNQPWETTGTILQKALPNHRITPLKNTGHFLQLDNPEQYLAAILNHQPALAPPKAGSLQTERLLLRKATRDDLERILEFVINNRSHFEKWDPLREEEYFSRIGQLSRLEDLLKDRTTIKFFIFKKDDSERIIGEIGLSNITRGVFQNCHIGYKLDQAEQGKGYMQEAITAVESYVFKVLKLHRIEANIIPSNEKSIQLIERLGYESEGQSKNLLKINGKWEDHNRYAKLNPIKD